MIDSPRKRGRPSKYAVPMSPAQRAKECRDRAYEAALVASEDATGASTRALLDGLTRQIKLIETDIDHAPVARDVAGLLIAELCKRYEIQLPSTTVHAQRFSGST